MIKQNHFLEKEIMFLQHKFSLMRSISGVLVFVAAITILSCKKSDDDTPNYPKDGLVSYFSFDNNLKDTNGQTPEGSNNGNATFTPGKKGQAITFNGTNQYLEFNKKTFKNGNNISISFWFKTETGHSLRYIIMCSDFGISTNNADAKLAISVPGTNNAKGAFVNETWTHMVGTYDGTNIKVYIDGVLAQTQNHPGSISYSNRNLQIGRFEEKIWEGSVDDLFIYNKVLTQDEITKLYQY